jgi:hypothetical protein
MNAYIDPHAIREHYEEKVRKAEREHRACEVARRNKQNRPHHSHTLWAALSLLRTMGGR